MKRDLRKEIVKALEGSEKGTIYADCSICGNRSGYDKKSLRGSTWIINGTKIVLCCPCEDELLFKIAKSRGIIVKQDNGEILDVKYNG